MPAHLAGTPIRMLVADIDGCLSRGTGRPFDHDLLRTLADANIASRTDATVPAITLCTGRPQPYVECLLQAIAGYHPALCESGTVFFDPVSHSILTHPEFDAERQSQLKALRERVAQRLEKPNVKPEPGKLTHITLIIQQPDTPAALLPTAEEIVAEFGDVFYVEESRICLHFLFQHIHKGVGLHWLSDATGVPLHQMAGIGDARPDLPFLERVGLAWAPANAQNEVKAKCHGVSTLEDAGAARELLQLIITHNRRLKADGLFTPTEESAV